MNAIELHNVSKEYTDFTLDHISFTLPSGCILGLIGENGAGKSTTIKLILDLLQKDSGTIKLLGKETSKDICLAKEDVGVVLDEVGIPGCLNARMVGHVMAGIFRQWCDSDFRMYLKKFQIPETKEFKNYSRGMKMKLGIAIALSHNPKLLILDEATSGLDPVVRDEVLNIFYEFTREEDHSILISSHIVSDLEKLCDYIAFLHHGKLLLFEEKDILRNAYAAVHCTEKQLSELNPTAVLYQNITPYGTEAFVKRDAIPNSFSMKPVSIEELFVIMANQTRC